MKREVRDRIVLVCIIVGGIVGFVGTWAVAISAANYGNQVLQQAIVGKAK